MHPPFGFALFYLRSIAPRDTVPTSDIYLGAIPWLFLQVLLVAIVIYWPGSVTYWLNKGPLVDPNTIEIRVPAFGGTGGPPSFGLPPGLSTPDLIAPPGGAPPAGLPAPAPGVTPGPAIELPKDLIPPEPKPN